MTKTFRDFKITQKGEERIFDYRVGLPTYGESLIDGELRSLGFNGAGYSLVKGGMVYPKHDPSTITDLEEKCAFFLEIDGQSLISFWEFVDSEVSDENDENDENEIMNVRVILRHKIRPVEVVVCTKIDGSGCFSRWLEIKNLDSKPVALGRLAVMSGMLELTKNWRKLLGKKQASPYRLGYFENTEHLHEGQFKWHDLSEDCFSFGGRYSRNCFRHPFYILENKAKGTCYAVQLAYSGGYKFTFDFKGTSNDGHLAYTCEIDGFKPLRVIAAGETVVTPEVLISMVNGDMDDAIHAMHSHIRKAVMRKPHGEGCYLETCGSPELAAKRGFDIVYIDAGWYYPVGKFWHRMTGKWDADPDRFPDGITSLVDRAHASGIRFGLWMEPERIGAEIGASGIFDSHENMLSQTHTCVRGYGDTKKGGQYNLADDSCLAYIEDQICSMIEKNKIDMFRLDYNAVLELMPAFTYRMQDGYMESNDFRYYENFYAMFDRIRNKYPNVIFENCASGGGRSDLGCVKYFDHTWVTDHPIAPRSFAITNGMTMCLPTELVDRLVTSMDAHTMASLEFQLYQLMFVRPTAHFPSETPENPLQIDKFREFVEIYNSFARPMLPTCRIYHHTPSFDDCEPKGIGVLESVSENKDKAMLGVFALCDPDLREQTVRFKGIDASRNYKITALSAKETFVVSGYELKYKGVTCYIKGALTAELFLAEAVSE
ncbi:MAG: alpha-galactosidase [Clostridia bacterium]|nr:alpha-galactosidase [Clostridia bacterium]